jgi:hypothetical protein
MNELIAGLLGVALSFIGVYVWWTHRRFKAFRETLLQLIDFCEKNHETMEGLKTRLDHWATQSGIDHEELVEAQHRIQFLLANREVPERTNENHPESGMWAEKVAPGPTVWDRLKDRVNNL